MADDLTRKEVAARLGISEETLRKRLYADLRKVEPVLQFHHYIGASQRWTLETYQQLRKTIIVLDTARKRKSQGLPKASKSKSGTEIGTSLGQSSLEAGLSALEDLQDFLQQ